MLLITSLISRDGALSGLLIVVIFFTIFFCTPVDKECFRFAKNYGFENNGESTISLSLSCSSNADGSISGLRRVTYCRLDSPTSWLDARSTIWSLKWLNRVLCICKTLTAGKLPLLSLNHSQPAWLSLNKFCWYDTCLGVFSAGKKSDCVKSNDCYPYLEIEKSLVV